jgi:hypothetical protein
MKRWGAVLTVALAIAGAGPAGADLPDLPAPSPELFVPRSSIAREPPMHPSVGLVDADGVPVIRSGKPVSSASCGNEKGCHDVAWIQKHGYHTRLGSDERSAGSAPSGRPWDLGPGLLGRWDPISYDFIPKGGDPASLVKSDGSRMVGDGCLLCHLHRASNDARLRELVAGRPEWAMTATLVDTGIVRREGDKLVYDQSAFDARDRVAAARLGLGRPDPRACGFCHGVVHDGDEPLSMAAFGPRARQTETEGVVFSPQRMSESALDLAGKEALSRPWDVHAERLLSCSSCHFSPNHPAYSFAGRAEVPGHLTFDARRIEIDDYLRRPDHDFAKGSSAQGTVADRLDGTIRTCEQCHDAPAAHRWLPRADRHFAAMRCESCHVAVASAPARSETDYTMLASPGEPRIVYRAVRGARLDGFRPVLLPRRDPDGTSRLAPHNLVTTWFWVDDGREGVRPVPRETLTRAFFTDGRHHADLVRALDGDGDGRITGEELVLDTEAKVAAARVRLVAAGANNPRISAEIQPYGLHHGIAPGRFATRACETCHASSSRIVEPFTIAARAPFGVIPVLVGDANVVLPGMIERVAGGGLVLRPDPNALALHVLGLSRSRVIDALGALLVLGVLLGALAHAALRFVAARRNKEAA